MFQQSFKKYLKHISWVFSGTSFSKLSCNPRHPSRNISCNHRHHLLQPSWRRIFPTSNNQKIGSTATSTVITGLLPLTNYISGAENETQRALLWHTNGNIEMRSPSAAAMLTMVAAATIVRFPPVNKGVNLTRALEHTMWPHSQGSPYQGRGLLRLRSFISPISKIFDFASTS